MALETKQRQPLLTKQKSAEPTLQKTPSKTQQPPSTALQPSLNNTQQSPLTATLKPHQQKEKKDPLPSSPMEGSIEFITVKEMLADLVSLLARTDPVILSLNNELISCGITPQDVYSAVANPYPPPNEKATRLINSLLAIIQTHSNPNSVFSSLVTSLQKVGLKDMASKLMENFKMKGGHVGPKEQQPSVSKGPLQPHTPQPTITGPQPTTPTTVIELSSKGEVATNIGSLHSRFATLNVIMKRKAEQIVQKGEVELIDIARSAAAYLSIEVSSLKYGDVDELFDSVQPHYDFFSCGVLKHLTDTYLSNAQTELTQYIDSLDKFAESSQLKHIRSTIKEKLSSLPAAASPTTSNQTKPVVIKLNDRWEKMTLKNFKRVLEYYFGHKIADISTIVDIDYGSVVITLSIPTSLSQSIIDAINNNKESMSRLGILEVAVDKDTIPVRKEDDNSFDTSLHESVEAGDSFEVSMLLQLGADPNSKDERGKSAVEIANEGGHSAKEETLAANGGKRKSAEIDEEEIEEKISPDKDQTYEWNSGQKKVDASVSLTVFHNAGADRNEQRL
ncbi:PREDICTED: uncharacterized protein LOC109589610 [Amphimedon queenslandica]|uniref:Uncharacterized protein n=1 Tax=Amphimedon queenslandica TaxID=400682 RepID=A0A1X7T5Y5_AMPQE|nr:PREDICTED: uncharacterized protein LOC109589610 [Amphimedon queenslandica]|eukprot:XP_019861228.1 PREDICTED: uncharacterized protein LOC109589610 [Amphimedon queenslandica]